MDSLELQLPDAVTLAVPATLQSITTYVLLEQERWFEKEIEFLRRFLRPGMTVIDLGANLGVYGVPIARLVGRTGHMFAYEPGAEPRALLEVSRKLSGVPHLTILPLALSDRPRDGRLLSRGSSELAVLAGNAADTAGEAVRVTSLDHEDAAHRAGQRRAPLNKIFRTIQTPSRAQSRRPEPR
jgi:FkbM family methyltransferase